MKKQFFLLTLILSLFFLSAKSAYKPAVSLVPRSYISNYDLIQRTEIKPTFNSPVAYALATVKGTQQASKEYCVLAGELHLEYAQRREQLVDKIKVWHEQPGYNLAHPERVFLINDQPYCAGPQSIKLQLENPKVMGISFIQKEAQKALFGCTRITLFHEIAHLSEGHYKAKKEDQRRGEEFADTIAILVGKCEQCSLEWAEFWLEQFKTEYANLHTTANHHFATLKAQLSKERLEYFFKLSIAQLQAMTASDIKKLIAEAEQYTQCIPQSTHPIQIERALRTFDYLNDQAWGIKGSQCKYHEVFPHRLKTKDMLTNYLVWCLAQEPSSTNSSTKNTATDQKKKIDESKIKKDDTNKKNNDPKAAQATKEQFATDDHIGTVKFHFIEAQYNVWSLAEKAGYHFSTHNSFQLGQMVLTPGQETNQLVIGKIHKLPSSSNGAYHIKIKQDPLTIIKAPARDIAALIRKEEDDCCVIQ